MKIPKTIRTYRPDKELKPGISVGSLSVKMVFDGDYREAPESFRWEGKMLTRKGATYLSRRKRTVVWYNEGTNLFVNSKIVDKTALKNLE